VLNPKLYHSIEKEADIEAAYRGNCVQCTQEYAKSACSKNDTGERAQKNRAAGYATKEELLAIVEQQKKCNALCKHHRCDASSMRRITDATHHKTLTNTSPIGNQLRGK